MKTLNFSIALLGVFLIVSCEKSNPEVELPLENYEVKVKDPKTKHKKAFKAKFFTKKNYDTIMEICDGTEFPNFNYQLGDGKGTHLGKFEVSLFFCDNGFDYTNGEGVFIAANGDELYVQIPPPDVTGHVIPFKHPLYEAYFQDPFIFVGGTGRFEGATGGGMTDSFVDFLDDKDKPIREFQTDHKWEGSLILKQ